MAGGDGWSTERLEACPGGGGGDDDVAGCFLATVSRSAAAVTGGRKSC